MENVGHKAFFDNRLNSDPVAISEVTILNEEEKPSGSFIMGDNIIFRVVLKRTEEISPIALSINIITANGLAICDLHSRDGGYRFNSKIENEVINIHVNNVQLYPGDYFLTLVLKLSDGKYVFERNCVMFNLAPNTSLSKRVLISAHGLVFIKSKWEN